MLQQSNRIRLFASHSDMKPQSLIYKLIGRGWTHLHGSPIHQYFIPCRDHAVHCNFV